MPEPTVNQPLFSKNYKWYVLSALTIVGALNYFDRQLIVILQEPIKAELGLSDTQLGLMTGLAFSIFYCSVGIPIARFADRSNRRNVIGVSLAVWSFMTAITGFVQNFVQMLLVRIGVGVGEAGSAPASQAIISDYFSNEERPVAFSIWATSVYIGLFIGFGLGGILESTFGWRNAFIYLGFPGILVAILFALTVKEPPKGHSDATKIKAETLAFGPAIKYLLARKTYIYVLCGSGLHAFVGFSFANWIPSFFIRVHEMSIAEVGIWLAISVGVGGFVGALSGGFIVRQLIKRDIRWYMWIGIVSILLTLPFSMFTLFSGHAKAAIICYFVPNVLYSLNMGALLTVNQSIVGVRMRAMSSAVYYLVINLVGMGIGPLLVGVLSDYLMPSYGAESLRWALVIVANVYLLCMYFYWKAGQHLERDWMV
ncbi:MAG: MFS transporter [Bacteroidota bacterium]